MNDDLADIKVSLERLVKATEDIRELIALISLVAEQRRASDDVDDAIFKGTVLPLVGRVDLLTAENEAPRRLMGDQ